MTRGSILLLMLSLCLFLPAHGQTAEATGEEADTPTPHATRGFVIGIEDKLRIVVWGEPGLTTNVLVRPDGMITVPLANDVYVDGLTPNEVREKISEALAQFIKEPNVTVIVDEINSFRVHFLGEISTQGVMQFYRPTRLLQAIAAAGGLTDFSKKEIILLREIGGAEKRIKINYKRLVSGNAGQENLLLRPGDTLLVE